MTKELATETVQSFQLGAHPPKRSYAADPIKLANYFSPEGVKEAATSHPTWAYGYGITFPMYANDRYGDCTCAAVGHHEQVWSARAGNAETPSEEAVLELYDLTGQHEGDTTRSDGRYCTDVLDTWKTTGFRQTDGSLEKILGYAAVDWHNLDAVKAAGWTFGGLYLAVALPENAQYQTGKQGSGKMWSCTQAGGSMTPGSWGGHAINVTAINTKGPVVVTWGFRQQLTWCFWKTYVEECYAILSPDWATDTSKAPNGLDLQTLVNDLQSL